MAGFDVTIEGELARIIRGNTAIERYHVGRLLARVSHDGVTLGVELLTSENARDRGK